MGHALKAFTIVFSVGLGLALIHEHIPELWAICVSVGVFVLFLALYFTPTVTAGVRHHKNVSAIAVLNLTLGWTVVGWVASLIWALTANRTIET